MLSRIIVSSTGSTSIGLALTILVAGCVQVRQTDPARTATEQLLLSTAADRAVTNTPLSVFANKKVFLDTNYFESYDSKYAVGSIRDALSRAGAILVSANTNSEIIVEARSGALSTDDRTYLIGIPSSGLPIPLAGALSIPEIALYKSQKQFSTAKFALLAYDTHSSEHVFSSGSMVGKAHDNYVKIIFFGHHSTDVPEMAKAKKRKSSDDAKLGGKRVHWVGCQVTCSGMHDTALSCPAF